MALKVFVLLSMFLPSAVDAAVVRRHRHGGGNDPSLEDYMQKFVADGGIILDFASATMTANNLGGHGPWSGDKVIRLDGVATYQDRQMDLVIETDGDDYSPRNSSKNGRSHSFCQINMEKNSKSLVTFTVVDHLTNESVVLPLT